MLITRMLTVGALTLMGSLACLAATIRTDSNWLVINETKCVQLRSAAFAQKLASRLSKIENLQAVSVKHRKRDSSILGKGIEVVRLSRTEAKALGSTHQALIDRWGSAMNSALKLPALAIEPQNVQVPVGKSVFIKVSGSKAHAIEFDSSKLYTISRQPYGISVKANAAVRAEILLRAGSSSTKLDFAALASAATFPQTLLAECVGFPTSQSIVRAAAESAIRRSLQVASGAKIVVENLQCSTVQGGKSVAATAFVTATAPNCFASKGKVTVIVRNIGELRLREEELWYCNNPEELKGETPLYRGTLRPEVPVRLLYHHQNATVSPLGFVACLVNETDQPARIIVLPGDGAPDRDPVRTGLDAGAKFLANWQSGSGQILLIPAKTKLPLSCRILSQRMTASGVAYLRLLEGGATTVSVTVDSVHPLRIPSSWPGDKTGMPWNAAEAIKLTDPLATPVIAHEHSYPRPFKELAVRFESGGKYSFVRLGQNAITNTDDTRKLDGNFGVIYTINLAIENPTSRTSKVEVVFETSAGYSAGCFIVDGKFVRTPVLQEKGEFVLWKGVLASKQNKKLSVRTMPLSGSSYPATIIVRPVAN